MLRGLAQLAWIVVTAVAGYLAQRVLAPRVKRRAKRVAKAPVVKKARTRARKVSPK